MQHPITLRKMKNLSLLLCASIIILQTFSGCESAARKPVAENEQSMKPSPAIEVKKTFAHASTILSRKQVPVLCYHNVRDYRSSESQTARTYVVPVNVFEQQMQLLKDSGYTSISPDQYFNYLAYGDALPAKPVMITFDDTDVDQFTNAKPILDKHGFKATFFIMTVSLGRPDYMTREQVKQLSDEGHTIGSHTWNHKNVKQFEEADWTIQIDKPSQTLEKITGKKIEYFAYPFGVWSKDAVKGIMAKNFKAAFQLSTKRDDENPLYTIRRIIVPGSWSMKTFRNSVLTSF